jgi:ABC-type glutathione transport system ATPase component
MKLTPIEKHTLELVAYMADEVCLEGLAYMQSGRAAQLSEAADIVRDYLEGFKNEKITEAKLIALEDELKNTNDERGCLLWKQMPEPTGWRKRNPDPEKRKYP